MDVEEIRKAYDQLTVQEERVNRELEGLMSREPLLQSKLAGVSRSLPKVQVLQSDAQQLADMIHFTATLAQSVSAKVRKLDLAKGRVWECQHRVHDLLDLKLCSEGVHNALQSEDYEQAAAHVHRFLSMDEAQLVHTARDAGEETTLGGSFVLLRRAQQELRDLVGRRFDESVRDGDLASVERFFKLFPLISMQEEGLRRYMLYLCSKLQAASITNLEEACKQAVAGGGGRANVVFADTLTLLFEGVARIVEIHQPLVETYYGPGQVMQVMGFLQAECDAQAERILAEFARARGLGKKTMQVDRFMRGGGDGQDALDPNDLDHLLGELTIISARTELYNRFVRRRVKSDIEVATSSEEDKHVQLEKAEVLVGGCQLNRLVQDLVGRYISLEQYFMQRSVEKAVRMDQVEEGSSPLTSTMVEDVFFIVKKSVLRAASSGSVDGSCAVVNNAATLLEEDYARELQRRVKSGFPSGYMDLAVGLGLTSAGSGSGSGADYSEQAKRAFLVGLNNAEVSLEYAGSLQRDLEREMLAGLSAYNRDKVANCLQSGFSSVANRLKQVVELGLQQLRSSAVKPRVKPWVDAFLDVQHDLTEEEFSALEANDPFVQSMVSNLDGLLAGFKRALTPTNYDSLIGILASEIAAQMEKVVGRSRFNRLGGLQLDKELRALATFLSSATGWAVRDKFARLNQMATLLNMERVSEVTDYWGTSGSLTWRLTPVEVRQVLALRVDFHAEDIKRLKL